MDGPQWMAGAMRAARAQLDVATHNLANLSTGGFARTVARVGITDRGLTVREEPAAAQGAVRPTGRPFDLALLGPGGFRAGDATTRDGAFTRDRTGRLIDDRGRALHGLLGELRVSADARVDEDGAVRDRGRIVDRLALPRGTRVLSGHLETSGVNAVDETLAILTAQRAFETAEKTLGAIDATREKAVNDVARLK